MKKLKKKLGLASIFLRLVLAFGEVIVELRFIIKFNANDKFVANKY